MVGLRDPPLQALVIGQVGVRRGDVAVVQDQVLRARPALLLHDPCVVDGLCHRARARLPGVAGVHGPRSGLGQVAVQRLGQLVAAVGHAPVLGLVPDGESDQRALRRGRRARDHLQLAVILRVDDSFPRIEPVLAGHFRAFRRHRADHAHRIGRLALRGGRDLHQRHAHALPDDAARRIGVQVARPDRAEQFHQRMNARDRRFPGALGQPAHRMAVNPPQIRRQRVVPEEKAHLRQREVPRIACGRAIGDAQVLDCPGHRAPAERQLRNSLRDRHQAVAGGGQRAHGAVFSRFR